MTHRIGEVIDKKRRENGLDRLAEGHGEEKHDGVAVDAAKKLLHGDPVRILVRRSAVIGLDEVRNDQHTDDHQAAIRNGGDGVAGMDVGKPIEKLCPDSAEDESRDGGHLRRGGHDHDAVLCRFAKGIEQGAVGDPHGVVATVATEIGNGKNNGGERLAQMEIRKENDRAYGADNAAHDDPRTVLAALELRLIDHDAGSKHGCDLDPLHGRIDRRSSQHWQTQHVRQIVHEVIRDKEVEKGEAELAETVAVGKQLADGFLLCRHGIDPPKNTAILPLPIRFLRVSRTCYAFLAAF